MAASERRTDSPATTTKTLLFAWATNLGDLSLNLPSKLSFSAISAD